MVWCVCIATKTRVLSALNLSLNGRDHRPAGGLEAVSTFMIARNARASFMGKIFAFCIEKSCRPASAPGRTVRSRLRSAEKDTDRTSGLKSKQTRESELANRTVAG